MKKYPYTSVLNFITFSYGLHMILGFTSLRLLEPPMRWVLVAGLLLSPILNVAFIKINDARKLNISLRITTIIWIIITGLYFLHPISNGGWILTLTPVLLGLVILARGDWRDED